MNYLETQRIKLRAPEPEDLEFLYQQENNTDLWDLSATIAPYSYHILKQYLENAERDIFEAKELRLMIDEKTLSETIGMIDLFNFEPLHGRAGVGIMITDSMRSKGYASEALKLLINYAFEFLKLNQLYCSIISDHHESIRLFEHNEFVQSGIKKEWINSSQGLKDVVFMQRLNRQ